MRKRAFAGLILAALWLGGCGQSGGSSLEKAPEQTIPAEQDGMKMKTEAAQYEPSVEEIGLVIQNSSSEEVFYGKHFTLEKNEEDAWRVVPFPEGAAFIEIALILPPGEESKEKVSMSLFNQPLQEGTYRIVKQIGDVTLAAPFEVKKQ